VFAAREGDIDVPAASRSTEEYDLPGSVGMHHERARVRHHFNAGRRIRADVRDGVRFAGVKRYRNGAGLRRGHRLASRQYKESEDSDCHGYQTVAVTHFFPGRFDHRTILPHYGTSIVFEFGPEKNGLLSGAPEKPTPLGACAPWRPLAAEATRPAGGIEVAAAAAGAGVRFSIPETS
jgi:hypothetical protein